MNGVRLHYQPTFAPYPVPRDRCQHPPASAMNAELRTERRRGRRPAIVVSATLCMDCGVELSGRSTPAEAVLLLWKQYGWHYHIGRRLAELAKRINRAMWRETP